MSCRHCGQPCQGRACRDCGRRYSRGFGAGEEPSTLGVPEIKDGGDSDGDESDIEQAEDGETA